MAAITRTVGETATATEALIHAVVDITAASSQEEPIIALPRTARGHTTRYLHILEKLNN